MPDTPWPVRYAGGVPVVGGSLTADPVSSDRWSTRNEFRGAPPGTSALWYTSVTFDVDVTPGTVGEVRFRSTSTVSGLSWVSEPVLVTGPVIGGITKWLRIKEASGSAEEHQQEIQLRRVSGNGTVSLLNSFAGWTSSPPTGDRQSQIQPTIDAVASSYGESVQTVTNPAPGSGHTMLAISVVPGPGFDGATVPGWTDPLGLTPILDYTASDTDTYPFVHRVRVWTWEENGESDYTFGFDNGSGTAANRLQTATVLEFDNVIPDIRVIDRTANAANNTPYPSTDDSARRQLAIALSTVQNSEPLLSGPSGWTEHFNNTSDDTSQFRRLGVHTLELPTGGAVTPGNSSYDTSGGTSAHAHFLLLAHSAHQGVNAPDLRCASFAPQSSCPVFNLTPEGGGQQYDIRPGNDGASDVAAALSAMNSTGGNVLNLLPGEHIRYDIDGGFVDGVGTDPHGVPGNHNKIVFQPGAYLSGLLGGSQYPSLDLVGARHWDIHNADIRGGDFGIRMASSGGTAGSRSIISNPNITGTGEARLVIATQNWVAAALDDPNTASSFIDVYCGGINGPNAAGAGFDEASEGIYIGTGGGAGAFRDHTHDINIFDLIVEDLTSEGLDIKHPAYNVLVDRFIVRRIVPASGPVSTPTGAIGIHVSTDGHAGDQPANIELRNGVIYGLNDPFWRPINIGCGDVRLKNVTGWDNTSAAEFVRVRPTTSVVGDVTIENVTTDQQMFNLYDPDGTGISVNVVDSIDANSGVTFIGPTTGEADVGYGVGSGFTPLDAPAGAAGTDTAGCPTNVAGAWSPPQT